MPTERVEYAGVNDPRPRIRESFKDADDLPTQRGFGHVYFYHWQDGPQGKPMLVEGDIGPGAEFVFEGPGVRRLTKGHVLIMCPACACEGRTRALHLDAQNKTVWLHEGEKQLLHYVPESRPDLHFYLPTLTVLEPVGCDYREESAGGCTWRAVVKEGRAYPAAGGGKMFIGGSLEK